MTLVVPPYLPPILGSALLLGFYDISKKHAVNANAVMPTLFFATLSGSVLFCLLTLFSGQASEIIVADGAFHLAVLTKSLLVSASWICVYGAMRDLPISIASPIRASSPLWTCLGGMLLYSELPSAVQAAGMAAIFLGYYLFSVLGKLDGFSWHSRGMVLIFLGTLLGAASALYDKFLLHVLKLPRLPMQFFFSVDLVLIMGLVWLLTRRRNTKEVFVWRWSIVLTGVLLIAADYLYFYALSLPDTPISQLSLIRRCNCLVGFSVGALLFRDRHLLGKTGALALILAGVFLLLVKI